MKRHRFVRFLGNAVEDVGEEMEDVADELVGNYEHGELKAGRKPPSIRERITRELPRRLQKTLNGTEKNGVEFFARVLSSYSEPVEQSAVSTDLGIVFRAALQDYSVSKGVLIQSKTYESLMEKDGYSSSDIYDEASMMLTKSSDAFVFVFPVKGSVRVIPAVAIKARGDAGVDIPGDYPQQLYSKSIGRFFQEFARCFIGDGTLAPDPGTAAVWEDTKAKLRSIQKDHQVRDILYIEVRENTHQVTISEIDA